VFIFIIGRVLALHAFVSALELQQKNGGNDILQGILKSNNLILPSRHRCERQIGKTKG
jgi:Flp pilus assembly protein TadB